LDIYAGKKFPLLKVRTKKIFN